MGNTKFRYLSNSLQQLSHTWRQNACLLGPSYWHMQEERLFSMLMNRGKEISSTTMLFYPITEHAMKTTHTHTAPIYLCLSVLSCHLYRGFGEEDRASKKERKRERERWTGVWICWAKVYSCVEHSEIIPLVHYDPHREQKVQESVGNQT